jgi:hypothetical protein
VDPPGREADDRAGVARTLGQGPRRLGPEHRRVDPLVDVAIEQALQILGPVAGLDHRRADGLVLGAGARRPTDHAIDRLGVTVDADDLAHRRGEPRVDLLADAEVSARLGVEPRPTVEQHGLAVQRAGQARARAVGRQVLEVPGDALIGGLPVEPRIVGQAASARDLGDQTLEGLDPLGLGRLVDPVDRLHQLGRATEEEAAAQGVTQDTDLLVGQLDRRAVLGLDHHRAVGQEPDRGLGPPVAHHRRAILVLAAQLAQGGDRQEAGTDRARARALAATGDEGVDRGEGQLGPAADARALELELHHRAAAVELDVEHQRAAIAVGAERHQALGQGPRQHRHRLPGQVVAGAAPHRLGVERGAGADVVRGVGDGVEQAEAAGAGLDEDRLIEIAGAGAVDGHEGQPGAIDQLGIVEAGGGQVGGDLGLDRGREGRGQPVGRDQLGEGHGRTLGPARDQVTRSRGDPGRHLAGRSTPTTRRLGSR